MQFLHRKGSKDKREQARERSDEKEERRILEARLKAIEVTMPAIALERAQRRRLNQEIERD